MRQTKHTKGSILIICEGENTEPLFYKSIRDLIIEGHYDIGIDGRSIEIRPEPKSEPTEEEDIEYKGSKRKKRKKRELKTTSIEPKGDIPGVPPLKWVTAGQKELEDGTYDEVWVVFDNDNHPAREEAFAEAEKEINGKKVHIAYSSIAFEYYILLHFERIYKAFEKSECREGSEIIGCMKEGTPGCEGEKCVGGYLRKNDYFNESTKGAISVFHSVRDKLDTGFENAAWLRFISENIEGKESIWDRNPYITTDILTKRLTGTDTNHFWLGTEKILEIDNIAYSLTDDRLSVRNTKGISEIIHANSLTKISPDGENTTVGSRQIVAPGEEYLYSLDRNSADCFKFIHGKNVILFE